MGSTAFASTLLTMQISPLDPSDEAGKEKELARRMVSTL